MRVTPAHFLAFNAVFATIQTDVLAAIEELNLLARAHPAVASDLNRLASNLLRSVENSQKRAPRVSLGDIDLPTPLRSSQA